MRRSHPGAWVLLLPVFWGGLLLPGNAEAKQRVAVLPFSGADGELAREQFISAIKDQVKFVSSESYESAATRLGVDLLSEDGIAAICFEKKCAAVIAGKVTEEGEDFTVVVTVYDGTGAVQGRRAATVRGQRAIGAAGRALGRACLPLVESGHVPEKRPEPTEPVPKPPTIPDEPQPAAQTQPEAPQPQEPPPDRELPPESKKSAAKAAAGGKTGVRGRYEGLFGVYAAMGLSTRKATMTDKSPAGLPSSSLPSANVMGYLEAEFGAEFYPAVFFARNFAKYIGIGVNYTRHLSLKNDLVLNDGVQETLYNVPAGSQGLGVDVRMRWPIFNRETSPVLLANLGWGFHEFALDETGCQKDDPTVCVATALPSFNYKFVKLGVGTIVPILTPLIAFTASFEARPLLHVGQAVYDSFGERTGGFGFSLTGGFSGQTRFGLMYFLNVELSSFLSSYGGLQAWRDTHSDIAANFPNRNNARDQDGPTGFTDHFIRVWLGIGYSFF